VGVGVDDPQRARFRIDGGEPTSELFELAPIAAGDRPSNRFVDSIATGELFGDEFFLWAVLGLIDPTLVVGDLGCGTGQLTETVAPYVRRVISVDGSTDMLDAARHRLGGAKNVELRQGELESLPIDGGELDVAMLSLVLHYSPSPARALAEVGRVVRKGGRVLVVDMLPHDREEYQQQMGHVWLGFSEKQISRFLAGAGFGEVRVRMLPADPDAKGPALFAAIAIKQ
jgi:ArsR family transcriptional regulator